jgi:hypothetical protein
MLDSTIGLLRFTARRVVPVVALVLLASCAGGPDDVDFEGALTQGANPADVPTGEPLAFGPTAFDDFTRLGELDENVNILSLENVAMVLPPDWDFYPGPEGNRPDFDSRRTPAFLIGNPTAGIIGRVELVNLPQAYDSEAVARYMTLLLQEGHEPQSIHPVIDYDATVLLSRGPDGGSAAQVLFQVTETILIVVNMAGLVGAEVAQDQLVAALPVAAGARFLPGRGSLRQTEDGLAFVDASGAWVWAADIDGGMLLYRELGGSPTYIAVRESPGIRTLQDVAGEFLDDPELLEADTATWTLEGEPQSVEYGLFDGALLGNALVFQAEAGGQLWDFVIAYRSAGGPSVEFLLGPGPVRQAIEEHLVFRYQSVTIAGSRRS